MNYVAALMFALVPAGAIATSAALLQVTNLEVKLAPVRDAYHLGEPIEVRMTITNTSQRAVEVMFGYPRFIGIGFECDDPNASDLTKLTLFSSMPTLRLEGKEQYVRAIALNRYFRFLAPQQYVVRFRADMREALSSGQATPVTTVCAG